MQKEDEGDVMCFTNGDCYKKIDNFSECKAGERCELSSSDHDFFCAPTDNMVKYSHCSLTKPDGKRYDRIGGSDLIYSCTSETAPFDPKKKDNFTCTLSSMRSGPTDVSSPPASNVTSQNAERIRLLEDILKDLPSQYGTAMAFK